MTDVDWTWVTISSNDTNSHYAGTNKAFAFKTQLAVPLTFEGQGRVQVALFSISFTHAAGRNTYDCDTNLCLPTQMNGAQLTYTVRRFSVDKTYDGFQSTWTPNMLQWCSAGNDNFSLAEVELNRLDGSGDATEFSGETQATFVFRLVQ